MPLAGRPFLSFMLDWLNGHGVDEVILSCGFMSDEVRQVLGDIYNGACATWSRMSRSAPPARSGSRSTRVCSTSGCSS